jgi:hypothetical protein
MNDGRARKTAQQSRRRAEARAEREPEFRFCLWCDRGYERTRSDQWFCSTRRRVAAHRAARKRAKDYWLDRQERAAQMSVTCPETLFTVKSAVAVKS